MNVLVDLPALVAVARRHGFAPLETMPMPWTGAAGQVFPCGDVVVKVPFDQEHAVAAVTTDARMAPFARGLGVAVPELIAFDEARDILPVPYAVFRRVGDGTTLAGRPPGEPATVRAWKEVGRQLARVHAVGEDQRERVPVWLRSFRQSPEVDPRPWVDALCAAGTLEDADARWLRDLLDNLAPSALADIQPVLCHGDVNAANVLVDSRTGTFQALIDWAGAGWMDPAWDFAGIALAAVPPLLAGHRQIAPLVADDTAEARILWCQVQLRLHSLREAPANEAAAAMARHLSDIRRFARKTGLA